MGAVHFDELRAIQAQIRPLLRTSKYNGLEIHFFNQPFSMVSSKLTLMLRIFRPVYNKQLIQSLIRDIAYEGNCIVYIEVETQFGELENILGNSIQIIPYTEENVKYIKNLHGGIESIEIWYCVPVFKHMDVGTRDTLDTL